MDKGVHRGRAHGRPARPGRARSSGHPAMARDAALRTDPNPLPDDESLTTTTYLLSLSLDIDVVPALQGIGSLLRTALPGQ